MKVPKGSVANWDPGAGSTSREVNSKLFATTASDNKDAINGTNELKEFIKSGGTPKGPFGLKGKEF